MAYGDSSSDEPLKAAWGAFCQRLREAGELVFQDAIPPTPTERATGFRYLTQALSLAFEMGLENRTTKYPYLTPYFSPTRKMAGDNADGHYLHAWIDGDETYKVVGNIGSARFVNITVQGEWIGTLPDPWGDTPEAGLLGQQLKTEWDGSFVLWLSAEPHEGNWLPLTPRSRKFHIRQFFGDCDEQPMTVRIERVGAQGAPPLPGPDQLIEAMRWAGDFVFDHAETWPNLLEKRNPGHRVNEFTGGVARRGADADKDPLRGRAIQFCHWAKSNDEALIVEFPNPRSWFWTLDIQNIWHQTLDYRWRRASINSVNAAVDPDDRVRVVVADLDPGVANWLDSSGHVEGVMCFRNMLTRQEASFACTLVKLDQLEQALPSIITRITPEERSEQLRRTAIGVARRFRV